MGGYHDAGDRAGHKDLIGRGEIAMGQKLLLGFCMLGLFGLGVFIGGQMQDMNPMAQAGCAKGTPPAKITPPEEEGLLRPPHVRGESTPPPTNPRYNPII